ncbi:DinB family protein [Amycolatopsis sp. NPDC048633]|uniref:DinB family protein n=1 Tax=Amycolatopsis sp. NPDC048633 TaxID=3157095 RepID=UPI0033D414B0
MTSSRDDLIELSGFAWHRLRRRMDGLTDAEYLWEPVPGCRTVRPMPDGEWRSDGPAEPGDDRQFTTLAWRLCHIADLLTEDRNAPWLGQEPLPDSKNGDPGRAAEMLSRLDEAYETWHVVLARTTEETLQERIGPIGGMFAESTRRAFVLHILDELIHHGAEAALLRDLYAATPR